MIDLIVLPWLRQALKRRWHKLALIDNWWGNRSEWFRAESEYFYLSALFTYCSTTACFNNCSLSPLLLMMRLCGYVAAPCSMRFAHGPEVTDVVVIHPIGRCRDWIKTRCNLLYAPLHETGWCLFERIHFYRAFECVESKIVFGFWRHSFTKVHSA